MKHQKNRIGLVFGMAFQRKAQGLTQSGFWLFDGLSFSRPHCMTGHSVAACSQYLASSQLEE
jgi:hypothetical protein